MVNSHYLQQVNAARPQTFALAELLGSLSYALDMTEGQPEGHCIRCCYIGMAVGAQLGLSQDALADLYYTLLLKDLGCSSNAARICELYLADDISFKRDFKIIDGSLSSALRFVFRKTGLKSGLSERIRAIVHILQNGGEIVRDLIETRCHRGADIAAKMRFSAAVQDGIRCLDEHHDGSGKPLGLKGDQVPVASAIALLAQVADVFQLEQGRDAALREIEARSGSWFAPAIAAAFAKVSEDPQFWLDLNRTDLPELVFAMEPARRSQPVDADYLDEIAEAFSDVVDAKSPYTSDHSNRVTLYTDLIAEELGLGADHRRWLRRAALLHDLGKLGVSNQVLDKPGKLDDAEWSAVRAHPQASETILARVSAFADIASVAGAHHERLDGKGYPRGLKGDEVCLEARILTVADVFDALTAARPYRGPMPIAEALAILDREAGSAFDPACIAALKTGLSRLDAAVAA